MRILLPMISLLIRAIVGSPEIHDSTLPSTLQPRNDSYDLVTTDYHTEMPSTDASKMWKRRSFREKRSRMAIDSRYVWSDDPKEGNNFANGVNVDFEGNDPGTDSTIKVLSKATENIEPRFNDKRSTKEKVNTYKLVPKQNLINAKTDSTKLTTVPKEFPTLYEGKNNPRFSWGGGKRLNTYEPSVVNIRRPIRVPFNSWGGKRAAKSMGQEEFLFSPEETKILDITKGFIDEINGGNNGGGTRVVQLVNGKSGMYEILKEKCHSILYPTLFHVRNETMRPNYTAADGRGDKTYYWHASMPNKRTEQHGQYKKTRFNPWGGKRSLKTYASRSGNEYLATPAHFRQSQKGLAYFQWI